MSLVTRGLGDSSVITRGYGGGTTTPVLPAIEPGVIDARPLLHPPLVFAGVGVPLIPVTVTVHTPVIARVVLTPALNVNTLLHTPTISGLYTMVMPAIEQIVTALEPYVYFDQFVGMPLLSADVLTHLPNIGVGDLLDYIYMTLGIAQDTSVALGIAQSMLASIGIKQTEAQMVGIDTTPDTTVVTDTVIEFNMAIAQDTTIAVGIRQQVGINAAVTQEVAELLTQTLDY